MMDVSPEEQAGIDAHRARHEALKAAGTEVAAACPQVNNPCDGHHPTPVRVFPAGAE